MTERRPHGPRRATASGRTEPYRCRRVAHGFLGAGSRLDGIEEKLAAVRSDMIELDVLQRDTELVVAHCRRELRLPDLLTLDAALGALSECLPPTMQINIDLKRAGYERAVVNAIRAHRLGDRVLISTMETESLPVLRSLSPQVRLGWSVPRARHNYLANPITKPIARAALVYYRRALPDWALRQIRQGFADAIMAHWSVITQQLRDAIVGVGGELYAWTVDDPGVFKQLEAVGVTGVISNDVGRL